MESLMARRKEILLGLLLVGFAVVFWKNLSGDGAVDGAGGLRGGGIARANIGALKVFPVEWASLAAARPTYDPKGRNIFQFGKVAPPPVPQPTRAEQDAIREARRRAEEERLKALEAARSRNQERQAEQNKKPPPERKAPPPPPPPPKPQPPRIEYKFIGYLGRPENKIAVLQDGEDLLFVSRGDELNEQFRVIDIGYESIKFGFVDPQFREESRTLPMSGSP